MDAYQYALMKETLERIQKKARVWRHHNDNNPDYQEIASMSMDMMFEIETILDECGFDE